ncbi:MAG: Gfo/Idh/MocA family oxidoreductase [Thermoanaerobaculia bacterium]
MSERPLRLAVVGCGAVAASHYLPALAAAPGIEPTLLVDADAGRARALAARWGVPATASSIDGLPAQAEAAVLALPNHLHAPLAIELLGRGVHVLVEKPMATSTADCERMLEAARSADRVLAVGLQFRFFDSTELVARWLASGLLGELRSFDLKLGVVSRWPFATDYFLRRESAGGGVLTDYGAHVLDLLLHWLGPWRELSYRDDAQGGLESDCELELEMASGVTGRVEVSRSRNLRNTCRFLGEHASLEVGIWDPDPPMVLRLPGEEIQLAGRAHRPGSAGLAFNQAFLRSLEDFAAAIREGRPAQVDGHQGCLGVALVEACYAARRPLELPWDPAPTPGASP